MERHNLQPRTGQPKQTKKKKEPVSVHPILAGFACVVCVGVSGVVSLVLNDPDQGKVVTYAEMHQRIEAEFTRISNDPYMPPQAKQFALGALQRGRYAGQFLRKVNAPTPETK